MNSTDSCRSLLLDEEQERTSVTIIGAGNVGWHLAHAIQQLKCNTHYVAQIYSRNLTHARGLAALIKEASATNSLDFSGSASDIFLICVPDAAIAEVAERAKFPENALVAHTSGSIPLEILDKFGPNHGVFYPLQTFTKGTPVDFTQVPVLFEAEGKAAFVLEALARKLTRKYLFADSLQRQQLHLAAIFACNFTNHLLGISHELLLNANLDTSLLRPLIEETIHKAHIYPPFEVQTGPAARGDKNVVNWHLYMLRQQPMYQEIYDVLSQSIEQKKGERV